MASSTSSDLSGVLLVPPQPRRERSFAEPRPRRGLRRVALVLALAAVAGAATAAGVWWRGRAHGGHAPVPRLAAAVPAVDPRVATLEAELAQAKTALAAAEQVAAEARAQADALAKQAAEASALKSQLAGLVGGEGEVTQDGDAIHLQLVDKVLFRVGDDALTERGRAVLAKVGVALNAAGDKQLWVQGHTDATPIKPARGVAPRFASNWELSAARALTVVHYLQDDAGVDPRRLAAVAFGEHRPASRQKARNRRIEIVLYPRHQLAKE